jgi:hypothetical protein
LFGGGVRVSFDPKGIPVALFALATAVIGIAIITCLQRPKR